MSLSLFERRLRIAPDKPGVYIMKDVRGNVLYVGKASVLSNRLRTYFGSPSSLPRKIQRMLSHLDDFECIVTDSEAEALILENTLIKRHKPRYNARLKDDKTYPYLKIDLSEEFPRVYITRRVANDGARYFGPFATAGSVRQTMDLVKRLFPYRSCTKAITGKDPRPCLEFFINRCVAPCTGHATKEDYAKVIQQLILFMEGDTEAVTQDLQQNMEKAAESLEFERAAVLRDRMRSVQRVAEEQRIKVDANPISDMDVIALAHGENETWVEVFFIRHNKLIGRDHFFMEGTQDDTPGLVLGQFIKQFYQSASAIPPRILLQHPLEEEELIREWLQDLRGGAVRLVLPQRGQHKKLIDMVAANATQGLAHHRVKWLDNVNVIQAAMAELQEELSLPTDLRRMECYDISHIQGTNTVGSMVVFEDGKPKPSQYRRFKVKSVEGVDDYESIREVLRRRFKRMAGVRAKQQANGGEAQQADDSWGVFPDLVLIDGGKGQLSAALEVFLELGLDNVPLASLAKENEWLYVPHTPEPIVLSRTSQALYLVQRIRDEAHRFAITYHRNLRSKSSLRSPLDLVTGIGPKRKRMLIRRFGSVNGIKQASVDEIASVPGITRSLAMLLKRSL
ncbi:MAG: excinuclease ABC subunit UvrC [Chloroflexi bacterium]|nr:excinuclease ABC subunit UvrC [Chloroflexota bacterium]MCH8349916.1 excinuclease ABC subunit UvrC [Chloroflexota bacterium]MCI0877243.1 excinuclease ABC subunit UvrC [Chloroflexota bacterium]